MYGIDDASLLPIDNNPEYVNVPWPSIYLDLSAEVVARLRQQVHLSQSQNHGIELSLYLVSSLVGFHVYELIWPLKFAKNEIESA